MHTWNWQTWQGLPYLTCSLLNGWAHGFFTQKFWSCPPAELVEALQPTAQVYRVKQVHGNTVLSPSEIEQAIARANQGTETCFPDADGLLTEQAEQAVWVCTADCTPVLIADAQTGQVAAIHAGWRGTALEIVPKTIARLQAQGSQLANLRIALGPAIAGEVYQVSTTVATQIGATIVAQPDVAPLDVAQPEQIAGQAIDGSAGSAAIDSPHPVLEALRQLPDSPLLEDAEPGRARLDIRRVIALQLEQLGIQPEQVAIAPYCTYQNPDLFFSYRREPQKKVQWSGIVSA